MRGSSFRKDSSKQKVESTPNKVQTVDAPSNTEANTLSMKRRFLSEEASTATKKQVFAKGKARSVSMPVAHSQSLSPAKRAEIPRPPSLQDGRGVRN